MFLKLIEAEDLSLDVAPDWREAVQPTLIAGEFDSSTGNVLDATTNPPALADLDFALYQQAANDFLFQVLDASATPLFTINRTPVVPIVSGGAIYKLTGADQFSEFVRKYAALDKAYYYLLSLDGYSITANLTDPEIKKANLIVAEIFKNDSGFYDRLKVLGIKREKRGDAETEFFTPSEQSFSRLLYAMEYLAKYKAVRTFGGQLTTDLF